MTAQRGEVLIKVRHDALIIANDGRPVSRIGVLSLCAPDLTEKSGRHRPQDYPDIPDGDLLGEITRRTVEVYRIEPNRQTRDVRHEEGVRDDYGGRYLWELIQNADDALAPDGGDAAELIGTKGLGFLSVLEVSDKPAIFSRPFAFCFNREASEALLKARLRRAVRAPTFEIPHATTETPEIAEILDHGYATAIRLPFRDEETATKVRVAIEHLDHRFLLLSQHIRTLNIEIGGLSRTIEVRRNKPTGSVADLVLTSTDGSGRPVERRWTKWSYQWEHQDEDKHLSVAVCLPHDSRGEPEALAEDDKPPVYMFFPTDETIGARAIIHASLEVTQNRKHFRESERNALVCPRMRELVATMLEWIPARTALDAFGSVDPKSATGGARVLASAVADAVAETAFVPVIGGKKVVPREVKVWSGRFGTVLRADCDELPRYKLLDPSVEGRNEVLESLGAKPVSTSDFFGALRYCRNSSSLECERTIDILAEEGLPMIGWSSYSNDWFAQVPCWWTDEGAAREITGRPLLFERPIRWPVFVEADAVAPRIRRRLEAIEKRLAGDSDSKRAHSIWKQSILGEFVHSPGYLEHALLPAITEMTDDAWREHGWSVLSWYRDWSPSPKFDEVQSLPLIWQGELQNADILRRKLSLWLKLPTDKGWMPAEQCYADRTWGAPRSFRSYFRQVADRGVVRPLDSWKMPLGAAEDAELWRGLLRFAGVSWEPKLVPTNRISFGDTYETENLSDFTRHEFDLKLEHFPECLLREKNLLQLLEAGRRIQAAARAHPARYIQYLKQKSQTLKTNFAQHQLREEEWLPHKKSVLFRDEMVSAVNAYLPGRGLEGLLPEIAITETDPQQRTEIQTFLISIGINRSLPKDRRAWLEWMKRLGEAARAADADKGLLFEAAKTLYRKFFALPFDEHRGWPGLRVPCFVGGETADHLQFLPAREARWVDEPIFDTSDIRCELLARGHPLFILFLSQAADADLHLGIKRLSKVVSLHPLSGGVDEYGTADAIAIYRSRLRALRAFVPEQLRSLLHENLRIEATPQLMIAIRSEDGAEIAATAARAFLNSYGTLLIAGDGSYLRGLGLGLARHVIGNPKLSPTFETILSADSDEEVIERLRDQGIPEQELDAVKDAMAKERTSPQPARASDDLEDTSTAAETEAPSTQQSILPSVRGASPPMLAQQPARPMSLHASGGGMQLTRTVFTAGGQAMGRSYTPSNTPSAARATGGWWNQQAAAEAGRHAEDWFNERLHAAFPDLQITRYERDGLNRESDFVVRTQRGEIHIEVKRVSALPGLIYWTELEFAKAQELGNRYCLAVLLQSGSEYEISWCWQPAADFQSSERHVEWNWDGKATEPLQADSWQIPTQRPVAPPRTYSYRITLDPLLHAGLPKETSDLAFLKTRIDELLGAWSEKSVGGM